MTSLRSFQTEGIILKKFDLQEQDRILTLYTRDRGKIGVLAKGVRKFGSKRSNHLDLFNLGTFQIHASSRHFYLTQCQSLENFSSLKNDLFLIAFASYAAELLEKLTAEESPSPSLFYLLKDTLFALQKTRFLIPEAKKKQSFLILEIFKIKLLHLLGFLPQLKIAFLNQLITQLKKIPFPQIGKINLTQEELSEVQKVTQKLLEPHLKEELKSSSFIAFELF